MNIIVEIRQVNQVIGRARVSSLIEAFNKLSEIVAQQEQGIAELKAPIEMRLFNENNSKPLYSSIDPKIEDIFKRISLY